ncbi:helix-turn-helix transcriptional regulator [Actinokineospora bangkokensis]|uniref:Transcriptional regulator n=1 Tax=Actinokineospora bangkokensis TaxID=1193682 RepID=A0A1Q9LLD4_9PSEU|nr:helix-turn-helix transcriptional regulator [Actinokineospora bangkokensis]OLR92830.1 transcriptional regulator [Actinokineospora bangkokensis]
MDAPELGRFLRSRREAISPADVGLPAGTRRRTPGLRREEVARLAFISTEHYTRLEQARGSGPSREVVAALARALRLSDTEREHLHRLAGVAATPASAPNREVRQSIRDLVDRLPGAAVIVLSALSEVIAWNDLAAALLTDFSALTRRERNLLVRTFLDEGIAWTTDTEEFGRAAARDLRTRAARYPDDPETAALVRELRAGSAEFERLWAENSVEVRPAMVKTVLNDRVGPLRLNCDVLDIADRDQRVVVYTAEPGSREAEALELLSVLGTQRMDTRG